MRRTPFIWRLLLTALVALAVGGPVPLSAQVSRAFELCFVSGVGSCSAFTLTATPVNGFTALEVEVRHAEGTGPLAATRSALGGFYFSYAASVFGPATGPFSFPPLVFEEGGAPPVVVPDAWTQREAEAGDPLRWVGFASTTSETFDDSGMLQTYGIGGCGVAAAGGVIDAVFATPHWSCGSGRYRFVTAVDGDFDLALVRSIGVDTYALFQDDDFGVSAFCTAVVDGSDSFGTDGVDVGSVCSARTLGDEHPVPEPSTGTLLVTTLLCFALIASRRWTPPTRTPM